MPIKKEYFGCLPICKQRKNLLITRKQYQILTGVIIKFNTVAWSYSTQRSSPHTLALVTEELRLSLLHHSAMNKSGSLSKSHDLHPEESTDLHHLWLLKESLFQCLALPKTNKNTCL